MDICTQFSGIERTDGAWLVHTNCADIKIIFVTDEIVRVRTAFDKEFTEESYVLMTTAWKDRLDPLFEGERTRVEPVIPGVEETSSARWATSSMYYPELERDSDDAVLGFIDTIKEEGFPIDGFRLSSGYTSVGNKRCVFTWNTTRFKDPSAYFHAMQDKGAENVPNIKPGILLCYPRFEEFKSQDVFVKDSKNPEQYAVGSWWGGPGAFWDFTKPAAGGRAACAPGAAGHFPGPFLHPFGKQR